MTIQHEDEQATVWPDCGSFVAFEKKVGDYYQPTSCPSIAIVLKVAEAIQAVNV